MAEQEESAEEQEAPQQITFQVTMNNRGQLKIGHTEGVSPVILLGMLSTAEMLVKKKFGEANKSPLVTPQMGGGVPRV